MVIWFLIGAVVGGGLGWLFDRRFRKDARDTERECETSVST